MDTKKVTNVLVLEKNQLCFERVRQQVLARYNDALLVRAADTKQLKHRANWAVFDVALVNYELPHYEALNVLLYVREHFPALPFILVVDKKKKYTEADIAIIKQADGCVYGEELFGQTGILDDLVSLSRRRRSPHLSVFDRNLNISKAIYLIQRGSGFDERREVLSLLSQTDPRPVRKGRSIAVDSDSCIGHRPLQNEAFGEDPHGILGEDAGAG